MSTHNTTAVAEWSGDLQGIGTIDSSSIRSKISVPASLSGRGEGTNTEDLFLSAAATCFSITLGYALTRNNLAFDKLQVRSIGRFELKQGLQLTQVKHEVHVQVRESLTPELQQDILRVAAGVEKSCLVSRAVSGNVDVLVETKVLMSSKVQPESLP